VTGAEMVLAGVKHHEQSPEFTRYLCNPSKQKSERTTGQKLKGDSSTSTKKTTAPITTEEQDMKKDKQMYKIRQTTRQKTRIPGQHTNQTTYDLDNIGLGQHRS
jgi:hypothetical protein